ncbi:glycosyltransferase family 61 protein [Algoriphagus aquimarinus]|uniref:Glycosyltransferase family 61 protein n=1 Tax=Algoriphagus aquimarinus TaxID=237018 RepID=A0A5C7AJL3_9BACT|nr:glycosyltransferase family 61 protein [Algoriphagus aquimarinus]TXE08930.1 glycosyltransferase family 61 protein [Algoriphagus aquimarinus]
MFEEVYVKRKPPANLRIDDEKLFLGAYEVNFKTYPILRLDNIALLQDTVFSPSHMRFYSSHTHIHPLGILPLGKRVVHCALKKWKKIPHGIWIKDEWSANYFHWITDCLPRLWVGLDTGISDRVILHESYRHLPYVTQSLEILNINPIYYRSNENLWVENLVLTPRTATYPNFNKELVQNTRNKLRLTPSVEPFRMVYISRKFAPRRKTHNEVDVELLMTYYGFEVIYAENLSLQEQISLMSETKIFVSLHGAALTNMIFLPNGSKVVELRNQGDSITQCYFNLANALDLAYYYTLNQGDTKDSIISDFTVDIEALKQVLDLLCD